MRVFRSQHLLCALLVTLSASGCALLDGPRALQPTVTTTYGYQPAVSLIPRATLASASSGSWAAASPSWAQSLGAHSATISTAASASAPPARPPAAASASAPAAPTAPAATEARWPDGVPLPPTGPTGDPYTITRLSADVALPYPLDNVISTHGECRGVKKIHRGLDIGGVGPNAGLGTPIRAITRARVVAMGTPDTDPRRLGHYDRREGFVKRRGLELPRAAEIPGYGSVHFFTRSRGWSKMGVFIEVVTEAPGTPLDGYRIRYMHMATLHPSLKVGDVIEPGQEIALMGGTAVQSSLPHLHLDMDTPTGRRVDIAPILGLPRDRRGPKRCSGHGG